MFVFDTTDRCVYLSLGFGANYIYVLNTTIFTCGTIWVHVIFYEMQERFNHVF